MGFALGLHGLKPGFAWFQTQDKPAKNRVYFLTTPNKWQRFVWVTKICHSCFLMTKLNGPA
jgi:hypothetical protein